MISSACVCYQSAVMPKYIHIALCSLSGIQHLTCWIPKPHPYENPTHLHTKAPSYLRYTVCKYRPDRQARNTTSSISNKVRKITRQPHNIAHARVYAAETGGQKGTHVMSPPLVACSTQFVPNTHRTQWENDTHAAAAAAARRGKSKVTQQQQLHHHHRHPTSAQQATRNTHARTYAASHMIKQTKNTTQPYQHIHSRKITRT